MLNRRQLLQVSAGMVAYASMHAIAVPRDANGAKLPMIHRAIPRTGELVPVIGMGTSRTFDTKDDPQSLANLAAVSVNWPLGGGSRN